MEVKKLLSVAAMGLCLVFVTAGSATINIETVPVGNLGNAGELSGKGANGYGADRICGAVGYEYRMGKYEVTAGQYTAFLNKVAATDTYGLYDTNMWYDIIVTGLFPSNGCKIQRNDANGDGLWEYSVASDYANRPVNYINWGDSARFANWLHNGQPTGAQNASTTEDGSYTLNGATSDKALLAVTRKPNATWVIPSEDEWYKAAYHENAPVAVNYFDYPTGSDTAPGQDMTDASGNNANYSTGFGPYPIDSGTYYTTIVGEFQNSASPYGTFDQGGNVWEWNEAILYGSYRGLRGGSFNSYSRNLHASGREYFYSPPPEAWAQQHRVSCFPGS
jgi:formylglycine-generating enzyme required for sulfatase activity